MRVTVIGAGIGGLALAQALVGADGARSRAAADLAGHPTSVPSHDGCIAARIPLDEATRRLPPSLDMQRLSHPLAGGAARVGFRALAARHRLRHRTTGAGLTASALTVKVRVVS